MPKLVTWMNNPYYPIARLYVTGSLNVIMLNPDNRLIYCQK